MNIMAYEWKLLKDQEMKKYLYSPWLYFENNIKKGWDDLRPGSNDKTPSHGREKQFDYFADTYKAAILEADQKKLEARRSTFEKKTRTGEVGEYILMEGVYELQWLKPDIEVIPTHEYDDVMKQVDLVLKFEGQEGESLYLGVDVTTTQDLEKIMDKRAKLIEFLQAGSLGSLKYFEDQDAEIKGEFEMPKIVIAFAPANVERMLEIMVNERIRRKLTPAERKGLLPAELAEFEKDRLASQRIQEEIELEVKEQLKFMIGIVEVLKAQSKNQELKNKYSKFQEAYKQVFAELNEKKA